MFKVHPGPAPSRWKRDIGHLAPGNQPVVDDIAHGQPRRPDAQPRTGQQQHRSGQHDGQPRQSELVGGAQDRTGGAALRQQPDYDARRRDRRGHTIGIQRNTVGFELGVPTRAGMRFGHAPRRWRNVKAVDSAAAVAWAPLSSAEPGNPARSRACSSSSVVSTPLATGVEESNDTRVSP